MNQVLVVFLAGFNGVNGIYSWTSECSWIEDKSQWPALDTIGYAKLKVWEECVLYNITQSFLQTGTHTHDFLYLLRPIECVGSSVPMFMKILKIQDNFDPNGQLDSIAPAARSNPTARRGRNYLEFFKIFINIGKELSTHTLDETQYKPTESMDNLVTFVRKISEIFVMVSTRRLAVGSASEARSNPPARRRRNKTYFF